MALLSLVLWALTLGFLGVLVMIYRNMTYWREKGIPYVETTPLLGAMGYVFLRKQCASDLTQALYHSCPGAKYFGTMDFNTPTIVVKDPEMVKEIAVKSFDFFPNHKSFVPKELDPLFAKNIFSLTDDRWREMRATLSPSFTASKMKFMYQLIHRCSTDFVRYLEDHEEMTREMDLKDVYTRYTNDVIATAAFGVSVNSMQDRDNEFYVNGKDVATFEGWQKLIKFMFSMICPRILRRMGIGFLSPKADRFFKKLINDALRTRKEKGIVRPDMIHLLMQAQDNDKGIELSTEDIIAQAFIFFLAGFDTSARLMCSVSHLLSHHTDVQEKLRQEVDEVLAEDGGGEIGYETLAKMKYMDMVVSETLRLYSPSPMTDRVCAKAYTLPPAEEGGKGFTVQPGTSMWFPVFALHRDPNYFPDPDKFDPERFSEENKADIKPYTYMPFGVGPRKCIGDRFALMESKILIAQLLHSFVLTPSSKNPRDFEYNPQQFLLEPKNGFWMGLEKRKVK